FDVLELTDIGKQLADALLDQPVGKGGKRLRAHLTAWIRGEEIDRSRTLRHALAPSSPSSDECKIVRARVFDAVTEACQRRTHAASALGRATEMRDMPEVARRLKEKGHAAQADDVLAAHAFGAMVDRA